MNSQTKLIAYDKEYCDNKNRELEYKYQVYEHWLKQNTYIAVCSHQFTSSGSETKQPKILSPKASIWLINFSQPFTDESKLKRRYADAEFKRCDVKWSNSEAGTGKRVW